MTRRVTVTWPDPRPFEARSGRPIHILAASDEHDRALDRPANRDMLGPIDLIVGCGDLSPERLAFLADAVPAPLVYVRGNHDRGGPWPSPRRLPSASEGIDVDSLPGIPLLALPWPTGDRGPAIHDERAAWRQVLSKLKLRLLARPPAPWLVFSHVPPRGAGDTPTDAYHVGFAAYRAALDRLAPPLWLHGHTNVAASPVWQVTCGPTTLVNVTGSVLIELAPPPAAPASRGSEPTP
jgi:uncharacterized protein